MSNREKIRVKKHQPQENSNPTTEDIELSTNQKKRPYRALSLDGGGARGLFTLKLLTLIAEHEKKTSQSRFEDEFDLIVGVSIGAIIGAAIACGLFNDAKVRDQLIHDGNEIFGEKNELSQFLEPLYKGTEKRDLLRLNFKQLNLRDCKCKLIILVVTSNFHPYCL